MVKEQNNVLGHSANMSKKQLTEKEYQKKIRYEPAPIKIIYRDGTIEYKNQTKSEVIDTILKGARKRK